MQMWVHPGAAQPLPEPWCWSSAHTQTEEDGGWLHPLREPCRDRLFRHHTGPFSRDIIRPQRTQLLSPRQYAQVPATRPGLLLVNVT